MTNAFDRFDRANQTGLGTASDGVSTYTFNGVAQNTISSISGGVAKFTGSTLLTTAYLGSGSATDVIVLAEVAADHVGDHVGVIARSTSANTYYRCEINGGNSLSISKVISGVSTDLATATFTYATTDLVWLKLYTHGTTISCKAWLNGGSEPGSMTLTATDSSITAAGQFGIKIKLNATTDTITFDNLSVVDYYVNSLNGQVRSKFNTAMGVLSPTRSLFATRFPQFTTRTRSRFATSTQTVYTYTIPRAFGGTLIIRRSFNFQLLGQMETIFIIARTPFVKDFLTGVDGFDSFVQGVG